MKRTEILQPVTELAKWRDKDREGKSWEWDGDSKKSVAGDDYSGDELRSRPGSWGGEYKRMTKKGEPTKHELGMQNNLKMRMKMKQAQGGLTGPKGQLPEELGYDEVSAKSASYILRKLDQGASLNDVLDDFPELSKMIDVIAGEHGLHPDDDFEEIENVLRNDLEDIASSEGDFGDEEYGDEEEMKELAPAIAGVGKIVGQAAAGAAANAVAGAANPQDKEQGAGSVEKISGDQVTVKTPDGSSITTDKSTLQQDEKGKLVLNKAALNAPKSQEKPLIPGTQVQVTSSIAQDGSDIKNILKLAGL